MAYRKCGNSQKKEIRPIVMKEPHGVSRLDDSELAKAIHDLILRDGIKEKEKAKNQSKDQVADVLEEQNK